MVVLGLVSYSQQELALVYHCVKHPGSSGATYKEVKSSPLQGKQPPSERWRSYSIHHLTLTDWSIYQSLKTDEYFLVKEL